MKKPYFGKEVDLAIDQYVKSDSKLEKEKLFSRIILTIRQICLQGKRLSRKRSKIIDRLSILRQSVFYMKKYNRCRHINPQRLLLKLVNYLHLRLKSAEVLIQHIDRLL